VFDEHVVFFERLVVQEQIDAFARRQLAALVLHLDTRLSPAEPCPGPSLFKSLQNVLHAVTPAPRKNDLRCEEVVLGSCIVVCF
jgi:hypothetical protein